MQVSTPENPGSFCTLCDAQLVTINPNKTRSIDNYNEVAYLVSNGSRVHVTTPAFCKYCYENAKTDRSLFDAVMESIKDGWRKEIALDKTKPDHKWGDGKEEEYWDHYKDMRIVDFYKG